MANITLAVGVLVFVALVAIEIGTPGLLFESSPDVGIEHAESPRAPESPCRITGTAATLVATSTSWEVRPQENIEAYTFGGEVPGPAICAPAGATLALTVENALQDPFTFHVHGVVPAEGEFPTLAPGAQVTRTIALPENGTLLYHALEDVAIARGLVGVILVRESAPPEVDREYVVVLAEFDPEAANGRLHTTVNGHTYPRAPMFTAEVGDRVLFHLVNLGLADHTLHIHGHRWQDAEDGRDIDNKYVPPHDSADFVLSAEAAGDWMYHCHIYDHINAGMMGVFRVTGASHEGALHG